MILNRPGYAFFIGFQWVNDEPKPFRFGTLQGKLFSNTATLLKQSIPKWFLQWEYKNHIVDYAGRAIDGELIIVFYSDSFETNDVPLEDVCQIQK